ncbi:MAG TPA: DMT family transporter [Pyrinomonadaceae bacterium]|jgi:drug/metabolite transporter (DMT)-like permease|nr:DMT family transporter [Pyrinomonadaceae bacterium]
MAKIIFYTAFALVAFAFNSILCRLALKADEIDAVSFTVIRLVSGAVTLLAINYFFNKTKEGRGNWISAFFLFSYAVCFSFAYLGLTTATGALILFSSVQFTMILIGLIRGERPGTLEWLGLVLALGGLVWLVFPGLSAPPPVSSALMAAAGFSWGIFTLRGRGSTNAVAEMTGNFLRSVPMIMAVLLISLLFVYQIKLSANGAIFAALSGAVASGIGYSIWYAVLKHHTATRAAILQLAVPALAAFGGVVILSEAVSLRLILASALILCGIGLAVSGKKKFATENTEVTERK